MERETLKEKYNFDSDEEITSFIESVFEDSRIPLISRIFLAELFLRDLLYRRPKPYFDKQTLLDIILALFITYAEQSNRVSYDLMRTYYSNMVDIEQTTSNIILYQSANVFMREFINKHATDYLKILLRPAYNPPRDEYVFEPFIKQTFKDEGKENGYENFKIFLAAYQGDEKLKKFIEEKYLAYEASGYYRIKLNKSEIDYLNEIQKDLK